jgi:glycosyltransferase involved in cell wall biosynthesis
MTSEEKARVVLDFHGKQHSLYNNLMRHPPNGYEFVHPQSRTDRMTARFSNHESLPKIAMKSVNRILPWPIVKPILDRKTTLPRGTSLIFASGHVISRELPWVVDLEYATHLTGYDRSSFDMYKRYLERKLSSHHCKAILPWTHEGRKTITNLFGSEEIERKTRTVHLAVPPKPATAPRSDEEVRLLFVGSLNYPFDFDVKGGKEVLEVYARLKQEYPHLRLTVRSAVPSRIREKYSQVQGITYIEGLIPWSEMEGLFQSADIFLFPSHNTPGLAILDAMSYGLPVVTTDVWANREMVKEGVNGLLAPRSRIIEYHDVDNVPTWATSRSMRRLRRSIDESQVVAIAEKVRKLVENRAMRREFGKAGRKMVEEGEFSITQRNSILQEIFDETLS